MQFRTGTLTLAPTDLAAFLGCRHRTALDLAAALGEFDAPSWTDAITQLLRERGDAHERAFVASLAAQPLTLCDLRNCDDPSGRTLAAMRDGVDVIVQARLEHGGWGGYADVLRRVEKASALGAWSYEAWDTKLARDTRGSTILQLSAYSDLLTHMQGATPEHFYVVTPSSIAPVKPYRVEDYAAFYRVVRKQLEDAIALGSDMLRAVHYPDPVEQCETCRWWTRCEARRRADDHLSYIADISRLHRRELESKALRTLAAVARLPSPVPFHPARGARVTYERIREQAFLQEQQRTCGRPIHALLPIDAGKGLTRLPVPSPGDLFLDLERARFAREGGRVYLFGLWSSTADGDGRYRAWWAQTDGEERAAFEALVDEIAQAWERDPAMHVYHFGHYDADALKQLTGRHATRQDVVDRLLRGRRLVDLHALVKQALRAGVESYSIKKLEPFYGFVREAVLTDAARNLIAIELSLEASAPIPQPLAAQVEAYNRDDCRSALGLRAWLERLRGDLERTGAPVPRPDAADPEPSETVTALEAQVSALRERLLAGVPLGPDARDDDHRARWLLAWMLDWHRREYRAEWWEYHRLVEMSSEDLLDESKAIAGLTFVADLGKASPRDRGHVYRYGFPRQDVDLSPGDRLKDQTGAHVGTVHALDREQRIIDIKQGPSSAHARPTEVFCHDPIDPAPMQQAMLRFAAGWLTSPEDGCGAQLLMRRPPRLSGVDFASDEDESAVEFATRIATRLDRTVLGIQGPPGAGKTFTGARMICALVRAGLKVGVTAVSHKVIDNLLSEVLEHAAETGVSVAAIHKDDPDHLPSGVQAVKSAKEVASRLSNGAANVAGGTAWVWASPDCACAVDVLFVDEAGQMSLANVIAISQAASSLVLLGDPLQLEQPQKASHPEGSDVSALDHVLGGAKTMPPDRGLFLPTTWRLSPAICEFTSELFYERRLHARDGLDRQRLTGTCGFDSGALWYAPVEHDGNQNWSAEEIDRIADIVTALTPPEAAWIDADGRHHRMRCDDILVVAPYNAQVNRLAERLPGVRVGTVDRFQGQEAAVVIYSMATSRPDDAPRGMEFLYSLNRLNVATSRARCAAILVASPRLFEPECRTPRQMQLANALCRFRELASVWEPPSAA